ncbi:MAG: redoxin domain-containing protein [Anaerolineales bacterium]|nr:redoxin domain-containing protein [Anaerolineales bacterium]MCB9722380.1 redoxin domain-containing protein [Candidatus Omnitrophota bacterium]
MKRIFIGLTLFLTACTAATESAPAEKSMPAETEQPQVNASLPDLGAAPELTNDTWLNVDAPLRLADLRGKVVIIDMWTFGCINCQHVIPSLKEWDQTYRDQGLVIIGNHYPEFSYEADLDNLKARVLDYGIEYAVAQDNNGKTWRAYDNHYWPTLYLIDKQGHIRYIHIGEGRYEETESAIQALLAEPYSNQ